MANSLPMVLMNRRPLWPNINKRLKLVVVCRSTLADFKENDSSQSSRLIRASFTSLARAKRTFLFVSCLTCKIVKVYRVKVAWAIGTESHLNKMLHPARLETRPYFLSHQPPCLPPYHLRLVRVSQINGLKLINGPRLLSRMAHKVVLY